MYQIQVNQTTSYKLLNKIYFSSFHSFFLHTTILNNFLYANLKFCNNFYNIFKNVEFKSSLTLLFSKNFSLNLNKNYQNLTSKKHSFLKKNKKSLIHNNLNKNLITFTKSNKKQTQYFHNNFLNYYNLVNSSQYVSVHPYIKNRRFRNLILLEAADLKQKPIKTNTNKFNNNVATKLKFFKKSSIRTKIQQFKNYLQFRKNQQKISVLNIKFKVKKEFKKEFKLSLIHNNKLNQISEKNLIKSWHKKRDLKRFSKLVKQFKFFQNAKFSKHSINYKLFNRFWQSLIRIDRRSKVKYTNWPLLWRKKNFKVFYKMNTKTSFSRHPFLSKFKLNTPVEDNLNFQSPVRLTKISNNTVHKQSIPKPYAFLNIRENVLSTYQNMPVNYELLRKCYRFYKYNVNNLQVINKLNNNSNLPVTNLLSKSLTRVLFINKLNNINNSNIYLNKYNSKNFNNKESHNKLNLNNNILNNYLLNNKLNQNFTKNWSKFSNKNLRSQQKEVNNNLIKVRNYLNFKNNFLLTKNKQYLTYILKNTNKVKFYHIYKLLTLSIVKKINLKRKASRNNEQPTFLRPRTFQKYRIFSSRLIKSLIISKYAKKNLLKFTKKNTFKLKKRKKNNTLGYLNSLLLQNKNIYDYTFSNSEETQISTIIKSNKTYFKFAYLKFIKSIKKDNRKPSKNKLINQKNRSLKKNNLISLRKFIKNSWIKQSFNKYSSVYYFDNNNNNNLLDLLEDLEQETQANLLETRYNNNNNNYINLNQKFNTFLNLPKKYLNIFRQTSLLKSFTIVYPIGRGLNNWNLRLEKNLQELYTEVTIYSKHETNFISSPLGFLYTPSVLITLSKLLKSKINRQKFAFFSIINVKKDILKKRNKSNILNFPNYNVLTQSFNSKNINSFKTDHNFFQNSFLLDKINSDTHTFKNYLFPWMREDLYNLPTTKSIKTEIRVKRIKFKPGYSRLWRNARTSLKQSLNLNYRYQYKLTRYLVRFSRTASYKHTQITDLKLGNILIQSKFVPDLITAQTMLSNNLVFLNGRCTSNLNLPLYSGDVIQLIVHLKYYITFRWMLNWTIFKRTRLTKLSKSKFKKVQNSRIKQKSFNIPDWVMSTKLHYADIPKYLEVDYFTLSAFVVYEPFTSIDINTSELSENRNEILNMYNWKYIN